jgi:hypothetical protein
MSPEVLKTAVCAECDSGVAVMLSEDGEGLVIAPCERCLDNAERCGADEERNGFDVERDADR